MRYYLALVVLAFIGCTKEKAINDEPEIFFDMDGIHYQHKGEKNSSGVGVAATKTNGNATINTFYQFTGFTNSMNSATINIVTPGDTLKTILYHSVQGDGTTVTVNNQIYSYQKPDDYLDIKINSYVDGIVNGTFSGKMTTVLGLNLIKQSAIYNGQIKNVRIKYQ